MGSRIDRLEERLVMGEDRQRWLREMTITANMEKVQPAVLYELILAILENALFPDEPSRQPAFVERELLRPVSDDEIRIAAEKERRMIEPPEEVNTAEIIRLLEAAADIARDNIERTDSLSVGCNRLGWDAKAFVDRWERAKKELMKSDGKNGGTN